MATAPFTSAFVARLENRTQAYRFDCIIGPVVAFKFYCCGSAAGGATLPPALGVAKPPVCILSIIPETQCTGVNLTFNIDASYSPTGNLAGQPYQIDYGDGTTTAPGNWGPPGNFLKNYANAGVYTVEAYVTDTLGVRGTTEVTVEIVDCANEAILIEQMYALSVTTGSWIRDMVAGGAPPPWTQRIIGLSAANLVGRDLKLDPHRKHLPYGQRHVWITTQGGPAKSSTDMTAWGQLYSSLPEPQNADGLGEVKANLDWFTMGFDPLMRDTVFILAGTATRAWVYWTTDGGLTWDSWQVRR